MTLNEKFEQYLPVIEADLQAVLTPSESYPPLFYQMLHYHMGWVDATGAPGKANGGKRIRPVLCLLVCEGMCGDASRARPAAAAVELVHNFSLLHDDIQDGSPTRRGRPTAWTIWGEAQAINAGDTLFTLAFLAIPRLGEANGQMLTILGETCLELTRGQHLDMSFEERDDVSTDEYLNMIRGKTAALLRGTARLGALAGGADAETQDHYAAFGENLGMAFQVMDDILDIWGDPEKTGKMEAVDIHQRKKSLPVLYGLQRSAALRALYGQRKAFDVVEVGQAIELLDDEGAREYAEELAREFSEETLRHLEAANPQGIAGAALRQLVERLLKRER